MGCWLADVSKRKTFVGNACSYSDWVSPLNNHTAYRLAHWSLCYLGCPMNLGLFLNQSTESHPYKSHFLHIYRVAWTSRHNIHYHNTTTKEFRLLVPLLSFQRAFVRSFEGSCAQPLVIRCLMLLAGWINSKCK